MKIPLRKKRGFTLVEMTVVIAVGLGIASAGSLLLNQQLTTIRIFRQQDFILREAPAINRSLTSILDRADAIRLHSNFSDAVNDIRPTLSGANALVAAFEAPDGTATFGIIHFRTAPDGTQRLDYYSSFDPSVTPLPLAANPSWNISRNVSNVDFSLVNGLFQLTLTGPNSEMITYTISPNR